MKRTLAVAAAVAAAAALLAGASLPPSHIELPDQQDGAVSGAIHVHTNRSDGQGSVEDVAAAASRAGLAFVVFTDHGEGTRTPEPPTYRSGVLCIDGTEISTAGGHLLAIDMPAAPYPLGGEPRAVVEDVHRLGGMAIAAHPDSPRDPLRWTDWTVPVDGMEVLNLDSAWRHPLYRTDWRSSVQLARALLAYPLRPRETIARLIGSSPRGTPTYLEETSERRVVAIGGSDAHARLGWRTDDPSEGGFSVPFAGYQRVFQAMAVRVQTGRPLSGDPIADAAAILSGIRAGRVHTVVTGLASPPMFEFTATNRQGTARQGDLLAPADPVTLRVRSNAPQGFVTTIFDGEHVLVEEPGTDVAASAARPTGVFRVEIRAPESGPVWIISNPIYVREEGPAPTSSRTVTERVSLVDGGSFDRWRTETSETSTASLARESAAESAPLLFDFALGDGPRAGQYAALAAETRGGVAPYDRLTLRAQAARPMRLSIQARVAVSPSVDEAWSRSVYLDETERNVTVRFSDLLPVGRTRSPAIPVEEVHSIIFVVDLTNAQPGTQGQVRLAGVDLER